MDLKEIEIRAQLLLAAIMRFGSPTDANQIIGLSYGQDYSWQSIPALLRLNMRALDFLVQLDFVRVLPGGQLYEPTKTGRAVTQDSWPEHISPSWLAEWVEVEQLRDTLSDQRISSENTVTQLAVRNWRQFSNVEISFHPQVTILTGANGSGKTTLLNILGPHFNWPAQLLTRRDDESNLNLVEDVGQLFYSNGGRSSLVQHAAQGVSNAPLSIPQMQQVSGLFISSHRSISSYQPLSSLPPKFSEWNVLQQQFSSEIQARYSGGTSQYSPLYRMKEALVSAAMHAYGNKAVRPSGPARKLWEGYQDVLRRFLPPYLQFKELVVDAAEIILVTEGAEFPLEAVSGGISAMLELSWQIFLRQQDQLSFTVCIDEPENHLHPELQRSILPALISAFPDVTFIVSTHSPFVVTSVQECRVYALAPDENRQISSREVRNLNSSATPDETLMSVLGLDTTLPLWAEGQLNQLMAQLPPSPSATDLRRLRNQLVHLGLDRQFPAAVRSLDAQQ